MNISKNISEVKPGEKIAFVTGPSYGPDYPSYQGIAYGIKKSRFGNQLRVKVTDDFGNVTWSYVSSFTSVGIGAYYIGK